MGGRILRGYCRENTWERPIRLCDILLKKHAILCKPADIRSRISLVSHTTQRVSAKNIDVNNDDVAAVAERDLAPGNKLRKMIPDYESKRDNEEKRYNKKMKNEFHITAKRIAYALAVILLVIFIAILLVRLRQDKDIPTVLHRFTRSAIYRNSRDSFQAQYERNKEVAQLEIRRSVSKESAAQAVQSKIDLITSLYEKHPVSYPDVITNEIVCADKYRPVSGERKNNNTIIRYLVGSATRRLTFGACSDDLIAYKALVAWYWCDRSKSLVQLELMVPKTDTNADKTIQDMLQSLSCPR